MDSSFHGIGSLLEEPKYGKGVTHVLDCSPGPGRWSGAAQPGLHVNQLYARLLTKGLPQRAAVFDANQDEDALAGMVGVGLAHHPQGMVVPAAPSVGHRGPSNPVLVLSPGSNHLVGYGTVDISGGLPQLSQRGKRGIVERLVHLRESGLFRAKAAEFPA